MIKWVSSTIVFIVLMIWFASPYVALRGIQEAIATNNADALSEHIDYDALRGNIKIRVGNYLTENVASNIPKVFKNTIAQKASTLIDNAVEAHITIESLRRFMDAKPVKGTTDNDSVDIQRTWDVRWWTKRASLDELVLHVVSTNPKYEDREVLIHFHRISGITWKVVDVDFDSWKDWVIDILTGLKSR